MVQVKNKVCLIVHDGWGIGPSSKGNILSKEEADKEGNAIANAGFEARDNGSDLTMHTLSSGNTPETAYTTLAAHGLAVGLSDGLMGNSEVGHLNIGAGRIVWQDIVRIDQSIRKDDISKNKDVLASFNRAKDGNGRLHLLGLVSDGGVHSHIDHLFSLLRIARSIGIPHIYIHFLGDGRDTAPRSAVKYLQQLDDFLQELNSSSSGSGRAELATIVGRYYAMDRDKRWERVAVAVRGLVEGKGESVSGQTPVEAVQANYDKDVTDEFLKPIVVNGKDGRIGENDTLFFFNYRSDRMREIVTVFGLSTTEADVKEKESPEGWVKEKVEIPTGLHLSSMTAYSQTFPFNIGVAFPPQTMSNVLAEVLGKNGVKQGHVAETEKYAHVTFFFNGGVEQQFEGEERYMIPSPKVATYDLQPTMSVQGVADKVAELLKEGTQEFVMCNFAPPDMVGHTGSYDAATKGIHATDQAVKTIWEAALGNGYILLVTADHGNAEQMKDQKTAGKGVGSGGYGFKTKPSTSNTGVEKIEQDRSKSIEEKTEELEEEEPALCDVAPTILELLGVEKPEEMTGRSLLTVSA